MWEMCYVAQAKGTGDTGDFTKSTWIADSGASCHMGNIDDCMLEVKEIDEPIKVGNGSKARATKKGRIPLMLQQIDGTTMGITLDDYKYSPQLDVCLFSIIKAIQKGWSITNEGMVMVLTKR